MAARLRSSGGTPLPYLRVIVSLPSRQDSNVFLAGAWLPRCNVCAANGSTCNHCVPELDATSGCPCGSAWSSEDPVSSGWVQEGSARLFGAENYMEVVVYHRRCSNQCVRYNCSLSLLSHHANLPLHMLLSRACDKRLSYDGGHDGVFNYSNKTLVLHEVAQQYVDRSIEGQRSFYTHWRTMHRAYYRARGGHLDGFWSRATHRYACILYM